MIVAGVVMAKLQIMREEGYGVFARNGKLDGYAVGDKVRLIKDIWDHGEDHHPPGYIGRSGDVVIVSEVSNLSLSVHHEQITDNSFRVFPNEFEAIKPTPHTPHR